MDHIVFIFTTYLSYMVFLTLQCLCLTETQPFQMVNNAQGTNMLALCIQQSAVTGPHTHVSGHTQILGGPCRLMVSLMRALLL